MALRRMLAVFSTKVIPLTVFSQSMLPLPPHSFLPSFLPGACHRNIKFNGEKVAPRDYVEDVETPLSTLEMFFTRGKEALGEIEMIEGNAIFCSGVKTLKETATHL